MYKYIGSSVVFAAAMLAPLAQNASANIIGSLAVGSSGSVTVTATSITWNPDVSSQPIHGAPWNMDVASSVGGVASALTFAGCTTGVLNDPGCLGLAEGVDVGALTIGGPSPSPFITFECNAPGVAGCGGAGEPPVHADLVFSISSAGPGSSTAPCTTSIPLGDSCSVFPGSPVLLTDTASGTVASLSVFGTVTDGVSTSDYSGTFSATLTGLTPFQVQQEFNQNGSFSTSSSGTFVVTAVTPEPGTLTLIGFACLGLGCIRRKRRA